MIVLGRIVAPFGIQGWVKIHPFGDDPASWRKLPHWWLSRDDNAPDAQWKQYTLTACRPHGKGLVAALAEVPDRNAAEAIDGFFIAAPREVLPEPAEEVMMGLARGVVPDSAIAQILHLRNLPEAQHLADRVVHRRSGDLRHRLQDFTVHLVNSRMRPVVEKNVNDKTPLGRELQPLFPKLFGDLFD